MDFAKFKSLFLKAAECLDKWVALQESGDRLLANAGNIIQRLPALSERRNFAALPHPEELQQLVLSKQVRALEAVLGRLQDNLREAEECARALERLAVEAGRLLGEGAGAAACGAVQPGGVAVAQMVEAVEDVWRLCRDDLAARAAALSSLAHTTSPGELAELQAALRARTGLHAASPPAVLMASVAAGWR